VRRFTVIDCAQRSPEWFAARAGRLTGSVAADIFATLKSGGEPACRRDLRTRLVVERLTGRPQEDDFQNADMRRGIELEPLARKAYEARTGNLVEQTGFLAHTDLLMGCSLDGHVGDFDGIVELKCPRSARHFAYLKAKTVPTEHTYQIAHNLFVSGAAWCDFVSFDPTMPDKLQVFVVRVARDEKAMASYEFAARQFLKEVDTDYAAALSFAA
jgi:putative phage-type endonuclease